MANCLRKLDVYPGKSIDHLGRERFHCLDPTAHFYGRFPGMQIDSF